MISSVLRTSALRQFRTATCHIARRSASTAAATAPTKVWPWALGAAATGGAAGYYYAGQPAVKVTEVTPSKVQTREKVTAKAIKEAYERLQKVLPAENVTVDEEALQFHGFTSNSYHNEGAPNIVTFPQNTQQVVEIVKIANELK
jgi:D-lactate dehydrogenase (cytochrome)